MECTNDLNSEDLSSVDLDKIRRENAAYEYLCHLEEARLWIEECIGETLPHSTELEARLRNGVYFAKLGHFITPHIVPMRKIFDVDQSIYNISGLHYRHTDNVNYWILSMKAIGLPSYFYPNAFDVYSKKNMPKAVYCLHALNLYLHRCGRGMKIIDLMGKIHFSHEEISSVSKEFKIFGIQLPAFSKIDKILTNEISPHDATLHAAIIAINIAICNQSSEQFFSALMNPNARLQNVKKENAEAYQKALLDIKLQKATELAITNNKYDILWNALTHKIIQEEIDSVNLRIALNDLKNATMEQNLNKFLDVLYQPALNISDITLENGNIYMSKFKEMLMGCEKFDQSDIQSVISIVNFNEHKINEKNFAVIDLNNALESDDYFASFNILQSLTTNFILNDFGRQFYHLELKNLKKVKDRILNLQDIEEILPVLTALLNVTMSVIQYNVDDTFKALSNTAIKCWELNESLKNQYLTALSELKQRKDLHYLSTDQIKKCITDLNDEFGLQKISDTWTKNINFAVSSNDACLLLNLLLEDPSILCVDSKHKDLYVNLLLKHKLQKKECNTLSRDEIQSQIYLASKLVLEAEYFCACLASINMAVDNKDIDILFDSIKVLYEDERLCIGCKEKYLNELTTMKCKKNYISLQENDISFYSWVKWEVSSDMTFYLNLKTLDSDWNKTEHSVSLFLNKKEIFDAIIKIQNECNCYRYEVLRSFITSLQSHIRGFLVRKNLSQQRKSFSVVYTTQHTKAALKLQSFIRMSLVRRKFLKHKYEILRLHTAAKVIQRQWRTFKINQNLNVLACSSNPPLSLMQRIIYMLEISNDDYSEEFKLHTIKGKVVQTIRYNQTLLREIDEMDIKIGLLIRNRITLEDLLTQRKQTNLKMKSEISSADMKNRSFKLFSKKYNSLIESYENLLYLLQTKSIYLSNLIISLPCNQATSFIESIVFSLYNFGSTPREEYLLLKMFSLTLEEDIKQKGDNLSDIIKGENIIMRIIISFYRKNYWRNCLTTLLQPLILEVLNDKSMLYSMDPVEIYKVWRNELEMEAGEKLSMPHEITVEEALCHSEVNNRFNQFLDCLLKYSLKFCDIIVNGQTLIPFGIMYISKILRQSLQRKYPSSSTEELNKVIGNFLYYRYINPAIIAPDVYDIISNKDYKELPDYERLKLSAIAKFLHFSVTGKKYVEDMPHLMCLNPYLSDCHSQFMSFFGDLYKVKELEEQFNINIFSEAIIQIPEVYMTLNELQILYKFISEKEYDIAPDSNDVLHEILEEFNYNSFENVCDSSDEFLNTEICLSLKSKYDLEVEDETEEEKTYIETKFMLITLLQVFSNINSIVDLLEREPTADEEMLFEKICFMKQRDTDFRKSHNWKTLPVLQEALQFNLNSLELSGYVSSTNNYQEILNNIAKDIVNRWKYRISRKKEIAKLLEVQKQVDNKTIFYLEKLDYYNKYIAVCLENMKVGKRNVKISFCKRATTKLLQNKKSIKCSGSRLYEKGILIEIKDLETCQFKNVNFEISPSEELGIFNVKVKFMGIPLDTVDIDIQELLNMQYQGIAEMKMFDCVKINNNLLLHFLNNKFYKKNTL